ncbi:AAA family ATPase [Elizabethkingia anophelis]|uniref:AAA family ATPase n=1 Tax=Elizabethkingia anophelis TaxID=1117645 RepID=UPI00200BEE61|nr:AAA family ATPase [Elizabethkingia anophelis]MCL1035248.1 ATP-binding protein [Elizabethkingia anophelis]
MIESSNLNILIENFRAINKADIKIEGITVLAGENGSGKSTVSRLVYYLYKTIANYDNIISENFNSELRNIYTFLHIIINDLFNKKNDRLIRLELQSELENITRDFDIQILNIELFNRLLNFITKLQISLRLENNKLGMGVLHRLNFIVNDLTKVNTGGDKEIDVLLDLVKEKIDNLFKEASGYKKSRSTKIFRDELIEVFHDEELPKKFIVSEFGQEIISLNKNNLAIPYLIQNVIYIDTPMMLGVDTFDNRHWDDLNEDIKNVQNSSHKRNNNFSNIITKEILGGEANYEDNFLSNINYSFRREDGKIFNLLDCATGIKSFSIIQLLLKNNAINDKTLVIIDEPESHLHPQWIIEYARLIVLLNNVLGIKFLIASHNPDMVSALKIISEKEGNIEALNYYLAEKNEKYSYTFTHLDKHIDPIFESFNIAFDRMNLYGGE